MKTKQQLLDVCQRIGACWEAKEYIREHPSNSAREVLRDKTEWKLWFVIRKLTPAGRELLAKNMGCDVADFFYCGVYSHKKNDRFDLVNFVRAPSVWDNWGYCFTMKAAKAIDECYRAWCRS